MWVYTCVNCDTFVKYSICTCKLERNSLPSHIFWKPVQLTFPTSLKSGVGSILLSSLFIPETRVWRPRRQAGQHTLLSPLPASLQLSTFHPALFFSTAESNLQVTLGTGRLRREESLAECVLSQEGLSWGWTLLCVRAAPAPQPHSEHASLWYSDKGQLFHS